MEKNLLLEKIKKGDYSQQQLLSWITAMPGTTLNRKPIEYKVGDVLMSSIFKHPFVLLQRKKIVG